MSLFAAFDAVVGVAHSAIEGLATLLTPTVGGLAAALAIVVCTILVRLLISPLSWLQARSAKRGAALAPEIAKLREKHKDDPVKLAGETLALQRANGAGPGMSLLPALVQAPFFMIMFRLVQPGAGVPSGLLAGDLFGVPLTAHLTTGLPIFAVLLAIATGLAIWTSRRARKALAPPAPKGAADVPGQARAGAPKGTRGDSPKGIDGGGALRVGGLARVDDGGPATVGREPLGAAAGAPEGARAARTGTPKGTRADVAEQAVGTPKVARTGKADSSEVAPASVAGRAVGTPKGTRAAKAGTSKGTPARAPKQAAGVAKSTGAGNRAGTGGAAGLAAAEGAAPLVGRLLGVLPYLTVLMVAYLPLAGALYLVTSTAWTALEQALWRRPAVGTNR